MFHPFAAAFALLRHWKMAAAFLVLLVAAWTYGAKVRSERALERCRGEAALAELRLERANQAAEALRRDSRRRSAEQERLLEEASLENVREADLVGELKRSAITPRRGGNCPPSELLRRSENRL